MSWFYLSPSKQRLPFDEAETASMVRGGVIRRETMVWEPGMDDWAAASEIRPEWFRVEGEGSRDHVRVDPAALESSIVRDLAKRLGDGAGWFRVLGVLGIVGGIAVVALAAWAVMEGDWIRLIRTLLALPLGILGLAAGIGVLRAARDLLHAEHTGQRSSLAGGMRRLRSAATLAAIGLLVSAGVTVVWLVLSIVLWWPDGGPML